MTVRYASSAGVEFIDLTTIVADMYDKLGEENVKELFATDHTDTSPKGAELNAASVVAGLKAMIRDPFKRFLSVKGNAVEKILSKKVNGREHMLELPDTTGFSRVVLQL
jgi:hypothetical protein